MELVFYDLLVVKQCYIAVWPTNINIHEVNACDVVYCFKFMSGILPIFSMSQYCLNLMCLLLPQYSYTERPQSYIFLIAALLHCTLDSQPMSAFYPSCMLCCMFFRLLHEVKVNTT